jgi:hypothetical protein
MSTIIRGTILAVMACMPLAADSWNLSEMRAKLTASGEKAKGLPAEEDQVDIDLFPGKRGCRHRLPPILELTSVLASRIAVHRADTTTLAARDHGFSFPSHEFSRRNGCGAALRC